MKKLVPVLAIVVLAGVLAVVVYFATRPTTPQDPPVNSVVAPTNPTFEIEDFMVNFDHDSDGTVTYEEFSQRYGQGEPPLVFTAANQKDLLSAQDAFKQWDRNQNGVIDADDIKQLTDKEWLKHARDVARRDLKFVDWKGVQYTMNEHQVRTFDAESGAMARGELPYAGTFWQAFHLAGRWSRVKDADGEVTGYASERNGRVFILTGKAEIVVKDPAKVELAHLPADDPHMLYAAEIARLPFDLPEENLALARKCKEWGMLAEAGMLYARVLIFQPANTEALDALGYRLEGTKFVSKGE
jgi:hypothetical protein